MRYEPDLSERSPKATRCESSHPPKVHCQMTLAREPDYMRNLSDRAVVNAEQLQCTLDPLFGDKSVWWFPNRDFECLQEVMGAQSCNRGEFDGPELVCQMGVDVIKDTPYLPRRHTAAVRDRRSLRRTVIAQQMHSQHWRQVPLGTGARPDHPRSARAVQGHRVVLSPGLAPRL